MDPRLFEWAPLGSAQNVCIFHPKHRFSKHTCIEARDLAGETIVDIDPQFASHQMNFNALRFAGIEPDIVVEYDSNGHEAGFVSAGLGVSITNEIVAREYKAFELGTKPVEPSALYHYVAVWQKGRTFSNALNVSLEAILSAFTPDGARGGGQAVLGRPLPASGLLPGDRFGPWGPLLGYARSPHRATRHQHLGLSYGTTAGGRNLPKRAMGKIAPAGTVHSAERQAGQIVFSHNLICRPAPT